MTGDDLATTETSPWEGTGGRSEPIPALVGVSGAAARLGLPDGLVRRLVTERRLPHMKIGKYLRFDVAELEEWLKRNASLREELLAKHASASAHRVVGDQSPRSSRSSRKRTFGAVRRLPSGRWQARYRLGDGRVLPAPVTFATKTDASLWLDAKHAELATGLRIDPARSRISLAKYAGAWLETHNAIAPRTKEIYESQVRLHILPRIDSRVPALGPMALGELTPELIRAWYRALAARRSPTTAAKSYVRLRQILRQAVDDDRIAKNPCRIRGGGVVARTEQRFATMPELVKLAAAVPERYRALVLTAVLGGLRQGELFALRRGDVDLDAAVVHVRRKRQRLASGAVIEGSPKSGAGRRSVALPDPLVVELRQHLDRFCDSNADAYVFTSSSAEPIDAANFRHRVWEPAIASIGADRLRFHDLRHTAGTLAARTGATTKELMARLGHSSPQAAMVYQHAAADRDRRIAEGLAEMAREAGL